MDRNVLSGSVLVALLLFCALSSSEIKNVSCLPPPVVPLDPPAQVYVDPSTVIAPVGQMVNVSICVSSPIVLNLISWQLELQWNPNILDYASSSPPLPTYEVNHTQGQLFVGVTYGVLNVLNVSFTPIEVFNVTFLSINYGISTLNVTNFGLLAQSNIGNSWTNETIPLLTQYERWPDVNHDGRISLWDLVAVTNCLGSKAGGSYYLDPYNSDCDFNNDSIVDMVDFAILAPYYNTWTNSTPTGPSYTVYLFNDAIQNANVSASIPGDINIDFKVNLVDLVLLANAYGSTPGSAKWSLNADINGNGVVDLTDLVLLALHYGQHYP